MSALILAFTRTPAQPVRAALPRWRLQLRSWWLARKGRPLLQGLPTLASAARSQVTGDVPQRTPSCHAEQLLELNLMLERARAQGLAQR